TTTGWPAPTAMVPILTVRVGLRFISLILAGGPRPRKAGSRLGFGGYPRRRMVRRASSTGLITMGLALLGVLPAAAQLDPRYVSLVERYGRGQPGPAVYDVDDWTPDQL